MLAGPGITTTIRLSETEGPTAIRIVITRLPEDGNQPAGTWDQDQTSKTFGTYLHLRAVLPTRGGNRSQDDTGAVPPLIEWDAEGVEIFPPNCSQLYAVGGLGRYGIMAEEVPIIRNGYAPRPRRLLRMVPGDSTFQVPPGHGGIGTNDARAVLRNASDNVDLLLTSAMAYPIVPGTLLRNPNREPVQIWTSFNA
jgi:hypothetical protein